MIRLPWIRSGAVLLPSPATAQLDACDAFQSFLDGIDGAALATPLWAVTNPYYTPVVLFAALAFFVPRRWPNAAAACAAGLLVTAMLGSWVTRDRDSPIEAAIDVGCIATPTLSLAILVAILALNIGQIVRLSRQAEKE